MATAPELDAFVERTIRKLRTLSPAQRDRFVTRVLEADPDVASAAPTVRALCAFARRLRLPLLRDGVV
jgi:hypothetical protein